MCCDIIIDDQTHTFSGVSSFLCVYQAVGTVNCRCMSCMWELKGAGLGGGVLGAVSRSARSSHE